MSVAEAWARSEARLRTQQPDALRDLPGGADPAEIARVEAELGVSLPEDARASYRLHNGSGGIWVCEQGFLMPLTAPGSGPLPNHGVLDLWRMMAQVGDAMAAERSTPVGPIRADWWHPKWVPLTENESGDFVCLDLAPAAGGRVGQVIDWWHEQGATRVLAGSFGEWLASLAEPGAAADGPRL